MLKEGASDEEIQSVVRAIQERYKGKCAIRTYAGDLTNRIDYGIDRRFHLDQLRNALMPSRATLTKFWLLKMTRNFSSETNDEKAKEELGDDYDLVKRLHLDLMNELQPSPEQMEGYRLIKQEKLFECFVKTSEDAAKMLRRLEELISNDELSLEAEMRELHKILHPKQIAKFIVWVDKNPVCMQLLEALWPHLTD